MNTQNLNQPSGDRIQVKVVQNSEEMTQAIAVRAAVYMGEMHTPYENVHDGNDFSATHLLALVDGRPAATMRIRYFGEFAYPERLAVLQEYRMKRYNRKTVAMVIGRYAFDFCRQKGYTKFYGHALEGRERFWAKFGYGKFEPFGDTVQRWGHTIIPMYGELDRPNAWMGLHSDPLELSGREGEWPSVVDQDDS